MKLTMLSLFFPLIMLSLFMYNDKNQYQVDRKPIEQTVADTPINVSATIEVIGDLKENGRYVTVEHATSATQFFSPTFSLIIPEEKFRGEIKSLNKGDRIEVKFSSDRILATKMMPPQISNHQVLKIRKID